jgi:hypothetical protein
MPRPDRPPGELLRVTADAVPAGHVHWLVPWLVPQGKLTLLDGDPGVGKSTLLLDWAARLTTGRPMPDQESAPPAPAEGSGQAPGPPGGSAGATEKTPGRADSQGPPDVEQMLADLLNEFPLPTLEPLAPAKPACPPAPPPTPAPPHEPVRGAVTILTAEDAVSDTIVPRLEAAGADRARVHVVTAAIDPGQPGTRPPVLPLDLRPLEDMVRQTESRLLIVDPLAAFLGRDADACREQDVRRCLHALGGLADRTGCAVVLLRHLTKTGGGKALYRGGGSIGIAAAARSCLLAARDPDRPQHDPAHPLHGILAPIKTNYAAPPLSLCYRLDPVGPPGVCRLVWTGTSPLTADDLVRQPDGDDLVRQPDGAEDAGAVEEAALVLRAMLKYGPKPATDCCREAAQAGVSVGSLRRAKRQLRVQSCRDRFLGKWYWRLPAEGSTGR